jgi:hypothetical protein
VGFLFADLLHTIKLDTLLREARLLLTVAFSFNMLMYLSNLRLHGSNACLLWCEGVRIFV